MWKGSLDSVDFTAVSLSSNEHFSVFQLILGCFKEIFIVLVHSHGSHQHNFQMQLSAAYGKKVCYLLLAICFRSWWRPKLSEKISTFWTYIHQMVRNATPNGCYSAVLSFAKVCHNYSMRFNISILCLQLVLLPRGRPLKSIILS